MMIWYGIILLAPKFNTSRFISFFKHLENTRVYYLQDSHVMKTHIESPN